MKTDLRKELIEELKKRNLLEQEEDEDQDKKLLKKMKPKRGQQMKIFV